MSDRIRVLINQEEKRSGKKIIEVGILPTDKEK